MKEGISKGVISFLINMWAMDVITFLSVEDSTKFDEKNFAFWYFCLPFPWQLCLLIVSPSAHALGFLHEQDRPDRDQYVIIRKQNLQDGKYSVI